MNLLQAIAIAKAINRYCRKRLCRGWDYVTWVHCYPQMASVFNQAAEEINGRPGRYLPKF